MKKAIYAYCFFILLTISLSAQQKVSFADSVKNMIDNYKGKKDAHYVRLCLGYIENKLILTPDSTLLTYAFKGLTVANNLHDVDGKIALLQNIATIYYYYYSDEINAMKYYNQSLAGLDSMKVDNDVAKDWKNKTTFFIYGNIGLLYLNLQDYKHAKEYYDIAYGYTTKFRAFDSVSANYYLNRADIELQLNNTDDAIILYNKADKSARKYKQDNIIPLAYGGLIECYRRRKKYDSAMLYTNNAMRIAKNLNFEQAQAIALGNVAAVYHDMGKDTSAIKYYLQSLVFANKYNLNQTKQQIWKGLYESYSAQKDYKNAINSLEHFASINDSVLNDTKKSEVIRTELKYAADKKEAIAKAELEKEKLLRQSITLEAQKNKLLQENEIQQQKITNQQLQSQSEKQQNEAQLKIEQEKTQKLNALANTTKTQLQLQKESEQKRNLLFGIACLILAAIAGFLFYKKRRDSIQLQNELIAKAKISDTEMKVLRLQMNPHFIFNSLNSIADYVRKNDPEKADYYLTKFAKLMRSTLENSEEKEIALQEELKIAELYMQLEAARLNNTFTYKINIDNDIDAANTFVPPLILQPFIENAIWHGLANKKEGGQILIHISKQNLVLNCIVEDNGLGRTNAAKNNNKKSYGINITKERLELLNKLKKINASVNLIDLNQGTRVELQLPFENDII
ncbi:MAG: histidine kinase [Bacteroidetes bacterium]|nr:histidine kinase [Bacteroidota bacterium]MBS1672321.1 histidine kinase [Bacteroidota bacterium]